MAQKIVGVDLGTHHIKVVVVSSGLRGVSVVDAFEEPVGVPVVGESDSGEAADPLGAVLGVALGVLRRKRLLGNPIAIALPAGMLSYRVLSFPFSDTRRIAQAVSFEAEGQFPIPLDQLVHGHVVVPTPGGGGRALVVAAKSDRVSQIAAAFRHAGADVKLVTSGAVAAGQVAMPSLPKLSAEGVERGLQPVSLVVDFGRSSTQLIALGAKGPLAIRTHRRGGKHITAAMARSYSLEVAEAEAAKHSDGFVPHRGF
ncbi:MAG: pilus assembly protein PilM, partial [Nannocystaceae bacterium]|nr:pilus assembly protein PilM [Nannocystaceae bacterium]